MNVRKLKLTVIAVALASALGGAYSLGHIQTFGEAHAATPPVPVISTQPPIAAGALPDMASIVERNGPAVVNISVTGSQKNAAQADLPQLDPDDPFYEFFRRFRIPQQRGGETPVRGQGSGFIVTADGTILTNAHVVDGADEVTVKLTDKREFKAKVKGLDKASDVAVLKIEASNLPTVKTGSATNTRVG